MIKLLINNQELQLPEDFSLSIQYNSGVFDFEEIAGSFSLPFSMQNTDVNNKILNFPHSLSVENQVKQIFNADLFFNNVLLHSGIIEVEVTDNNEFQCIFKFDTGEFASKYNDQLLTDCELGGEREWIWLNDYNNENSDFALPTYKMANFSKESPLESLISYSNYIYFINVYSDDIWPEYEYKYLFKFLVDNLPEQFSIYTPVVPYPFLFKIVNYLFSELGFNLEENFFETDEYLKKIVMFSINDIQQSTVKYSSYYGRNVFTYILDTYNLSDCVPDVTIANFILSLKNYFCLDFQFKNGTVKIKNLKDYLTDNEFIDISDKCLDGEKKTIIEKSTGFSITYSQDSDEFYSEIEDVKPYYKKELEIEYYPYSLSGEVGEINDLVLYHDYVVFNRSDFWVKFFYDFDTSHADPNWRNLSWGDLNNYYSNFETDFEFKTNAGQFLYRESSLPGNSKFHYEKKSFNLRLGLFAGLNTYYEYEDPDMPVPRIYNYIEDLYLNFWSDDKGLFQKYWKNFTDWFFNIKYEIQKKILFNIADLKNIDFTRKYKIDEHLFFIKSIQIVLKNNGTIEPATVVLLPV